MCLRLTELYAEKLEVEPFIHRTKSRDWCKHIVTYYTKSSNHKGCAQFLDMHFDQPTWQLLVLINTNYNCRLFDAVHQLLHLVRNKVELSKSIIISKYKWNSTKKKGKHSEGIACKSGDNNLDFISKPFINGYLRCHTTDAPLAHEQNSIFKCK